MGDFNSIQQVTVWILPILFAITLHEAAHAFAAYKLGDKTAYQQGRLTLNPISHIDPVGTILIPALLIALSAPFLFGWAKPVPVNWGNLRNPKRDIAIVALAGPLSNLIMAILWVMVINIGLALVTTYPMTEFLIYTGQAGVLINLVLMILNLLPILPLDGGRILFSLLPHRLAYKYGQSEPYGFFILIALLATGILGMIMVPLIKIAYAGLLLLVIA
ncbi:site-2 protease family protein [Candidatus Albibeggiatoa sp. nov. NOAA]|uniref:site-2 protease family protein n=1 Tax=Candidatus Albibeggiatoa sp. nov. NOAA TaxID=3162724 RepID=UPI0032F231A0|nr:site-2 protease family protein [Thiotrichaceae bacterium]